MIIKKTLSLAASIISLFILQFIFFTNSNSQDNDSKYYSNDNGVLSIMYHRFNENKYPSTNVRMEVFHKQMEVIKELGYKFYNPESFLEEFEKPKNEKKILITIDDGFKSFYNEAWPYLKKNNIPFILFVASKISARITFDFLLLSQSVYSKLIDPIKSSDASDCSLTFPLKE